MSLFCANSKARSLTCSLVIALSGLIFFSGQLLAAEIAGQRGLSGEIEVMISGYLATGDLEKIKGQLAAMISKLSASEHPPVVFSLDTSGGEINEAIKIGRFARRMMAQTRVVGKIFVTPDSREGKAISESSFFKSSLLSLIKTLPAGVELGPEHLTKAYSAGVIIFYGGVERFIQDNIDKRRDPDKPESIPVIGIHRPYYNKKYFAKLKPSEASQSYLYLEQRVRTYLSEMGAPQAMIDRMFDSASTEIELVAKEEFAKMFREKEPFVEEWLIAKCGEAGAQRALTPREYIDLTDLEKKEKQRIGRPLNDSAGLNDDQILGFDDDYGEKLLDKVRDYNFQVNTCQKFATSEYQKEWAREYLAEREKPQDIKKPRRGVKIVD